MTSSLGEMVALAVVTVAPLASIPHNPKSQGRPTLREGGGARVCPAGAQSWVFGWGLERGGGKGERRVQAAGISVGRGWCKRRGGQRTAIIAKFSSFFIFLHS